MTGVLKACDKLPVASRHRPALAWEEENPPPFKDFPTSHPRGRRTYALGFGFLPDVDRQFILGVEVHEQSDVLMREILRPEIE